MPNADHLEILSRGVAEWNVWRAAHPEVVPDLTTANLEGADLPAVNFEGTDLSGAILANANLREARMNGAKAIRTEISGTDLVGLRAWNADFSRSDFGGSLLTGAILTESRIANANLSGAELNAAELSFTNLSESRLRATDFSEACLHYTDLRRSELTNAVLRATQLVGTQVAGADFTRARLGWTLLADVDLADARGLREVVHLGPSTIGIDTLLKSRGIIPEEFLRGAGVPEIAREALLSKARDATNFASPSCFISGELADEAFAARLHERMAQEAIRSWLVPESVRSSRQLQRVWWGAVHSADRVLVILPEHERPGSWGGGDLQHARETEARLDAKILIMLRVSKNPSAAHGPGSHEAHNFSKWKNPAGFEAAFQALLRELRR